MAATSGLGPAKYALAGGAFLALLALGWHLSRLSDMRERAGVKGARFHLETLTVPRERVLVAARYGSFPHLPSEPPTLTRQEAETFKLGRGKQHFDAIWFNHAEPLGASAYVAYRLDNNTFNGITRVQMVIEHAQ